MLNGLDVSFYQQNINWSQVASAGYSFCYIKASEGSSRIEPMALNQAQGAKSVNILTGFYHFAHCEDSFLNEANFFDAAIKNLPQSDLLPVLDIETNKKNLSAQQVTAWMEGFVTQMLALGYPNVIIYSYTPFLNQYLLPSTILAPCKLWLASYTTAPQPKIPNGFTKYDLWQTSGSGVVPGVQNKVDVNVCSDLSPLLLNQPSA